MTYGTGSRSGLAMTTDTSLDAYRRVLTDGTVGKQQAAILTFFINNRTGDYTNGEVAKYTGIKNSSVCARMNELRCRNYLVFSKDRICRDSGFRANSWKLKQDSKKI